MPAPNTGGQLRTSLADMQVGDYIKVGISSVTNDFSLENIGTTELPVAGLAWGTNMQPYFWYMIKTDKGLLISDRVTHNSVAWTTLNSNEYVEGIAKTLGSVTGRIRSLGGGNHHLSSSGVGQTTHAGLGAWPVDNEWDKYVVGMFNGANDVWNWNACCTIVQDTPANGIVDHQSIESGSNDERVWRGYLEANRLSFASATGTWATLGFRPVFQYEEV